MFSCCSPRKKKKKNKQGKQKEPLEKEKAPLQKEEEQQREDGTQTQPPQVNTEKRGGILTCITIVRVFSERLTDV